MEFFFITSGPNLYDSCLGTYSMENENSHLFTQKYRITWDVKELCILSKNRMNLGPVVRSMVS